MRRRIISDGGQRWSNILSLKLCSYSVFLYTKSLYFGWIFDVKCVIILLRVSSFRSARCFECVQIAISAEKV